MKKQFPLLLVGVSSLALVGFTALSGVKITQAKGDLSNTTWKHYDAVEATYETRGIKEYWTDCIGGQPVFEKPVDVTVNEGGIPSEAFISSLAIDDSRLIPAFKEYPVLSNEHAIKYVLASDDSEVALSISDEVDNRYGNVYSFDFTTITGNKDNYAYMEVNKDDILDSAAIYVYSDTNMLVGYGSVSSDGYAIKAGQWNKVKLTKKVIETASGSRFYFFSSSVDSLNKLGTIKVTNFVKDITSNDDMLTVTWKNDDGSILAIDNVKEGEIPNYNGELPTKLDDDKFTYSFNGWSPEIVPVVDNATYIAQYNYVLKTYKLSITSIDKEKGSVSFSGTGHFEEDIVVSATPKEGFIFSGWYTDLNNKVSEENPYSFKMPNHDYSLIAHFDIDTSKEDEKNKWDKEHGVIPNVDLNNNTITYGIYPQTKISDVSLLDSLNSLSETSINGWYLFNNEYYVKETAYPRTGDKATNLTFLDGSSIETGMTYWYKCEPITWNIIKSDDNSNEYYLLTSMLLDTKSYYSSTKEREINGETIYANNYEHSDIREWLNDSFYNTAFFLNKDYIATSLVDNSASTTSSESNEYICNNTNDKVYLPSYKDLINEEYGFNSSVYNKDQRRMIKVTDYAKSKGAFALNSTGSDKDNGYYWTRSPHSSYADTCYYVSSMGQLVSIYCSQTFLCIRPAINLVFEGKK